MRRPGNIFYTIIVFTRRDPPGNMDAKEGGDGLVAEVAQGSEKGATKRRRRERAKEGR